MESLLELKYDSWHSPGLRGVRGSSLEYRHLIYESKHFGVHLMLQPGQKESFLIGQIVSHDPALQADGSWIVLRIRGRELTKQKTNAAGEFMLPPLSNRQFRSVRSLTTTIQPVITATGHQGKQLSLFING